MMHWHWMMGWWPPFPSPADPRRPPHAFYFENDDRFDNDAQEKDKKSCKKEKGKKGEKKVKKEKRAFGWDAHFVYLLSQLKK